MKKVYFVRHGQTEGNKTNAYQLPTIPLSEEGKAQAAFLAERFAKIPFDVLIASHMERAQETARAIGEKTGHTVVKEPLFHEILRPSAIRGKLQTDPEVMEVMKTVRANWRTEGAKHSDEENFYDLKDRAARGLEYLTTRAEETIAVVTHGTILNMMIAVMMAGENIDPDFFKKIDQFFHSENTGITWCEYDNKYHPNRWQLITWNDHAHLG